MLRIIKIVPIVFLTIFSLFTISDSVFTESFNSDSGDKIYSPIPGWVMIVDIKLENNMPTIKDVTIKKGRYMEKRDKEFIPLNKSTKPQLAILDSFHDIIFRTDFDYPKFITIPTSPPSIFDPYTPSVMPIKEPEVSIVIPYFQEASFIAIFNPNEASPAVIKPIERDNYIDLSNETFFGK